MYKDKVKTNAKVPINPNDNISSIRPPEKALKILNSSSSSSSNENENANSKLKFREAPNSSFKNEV
jgi:hypothetical protein